MRVRLYILINVLVIALPVLVFAQEYTLDDLFRLSLERSESIKLAEEDLYISEREKDRARADFIPTFSAFGYHTRYSEEITSSGFLIQPQYTNEWGLSLKKTYSLGGREFRSYGIAKKGIEQREHDLHAVREQQLLDIAVQYYAVLRAKREIEIATANVQRLTKQRDAAGKRLEVGEAIRTDLLRAEAELADARSERIRSENALKISKNVLARSAGIQNGFDVKDPQPEIEINTGKKEEPDLDFLPEDCQLSTVECLKELALSERAEIRSLTINEKIAQGEIGVAKSLYWPNLSIEGFYFNQKNEPERSFELEESIYGALKLDFPFFEGGLRRADVSRAKARLRQAQLRLSELKRRVSVEVENSYITAMTEAAVLHTRQAEVNFARDNYNLVSKQFQHGLADSIDVIDANTRLLTSERGLVNAKYVYILAILRLKRVTGVLLTEITGRPGMQDDSRYK